MNAKSWSLKKSNETGSVKLSSNEYTCKSWHSFNIVEVMIIQYLINECNNGIRDGSTIQLKIKGIPINLSLLLIN